MEGTKGGFIKNPGNLFLKETSVRVLRRFKMCHLLSHSAGKAEAATTSLSVFFRIKSPPSSHGTMDEGKEDLTGLTQHLLEQAGSLEW